MHVHACTHTSYTHIHTPYMHIHIHSHTYIHTTHIYLQSHTYIRTHIHNTHIQKYMLLRIQPSPELFRLDTQGTLRIGPSSGYRLGCCAVFSVYCHISISLTKRYVVSTDGISYDLWYYMYCIYKMYEIYMISMNRSTREESGKGSTRGSQ